jgi:hypothetical protein
MCLFDVLRSTPPRLRGSGVVKPYQIALPEASFTFAFHASSTSLVTLSGIGT